MANNFNVFRKLQYNKLSVAKLLQLLFHWKSFFRYVAYIWTNDRAVILDTLQSKKKYTKQNTFYF